MEPDRDGSELTLLANLRANRATLVELFAHQSNHWGFEDPIYRFYHQSWKVFALQSQTEAIVATLRQLVPERELHSSFVAIVARGTGRQFSMNDNQRWLDAAALLYLYGLR